MKLSRKQFLASLPAGLLGLGAIAMGNGAEGKAKSKVKGKVLNYKEISKLVNETSIDKYIQPYTGIPKTYMPNKMVGKWRRNEKLYYGVPPHESLYKIHIDAEKLMKDITG